MFYFLLKTVPVLHADSVKSIYKPYIRSENCCAVRFNVTCSGRNVSAIYRILLFPSAGQTDVGDSTILRKAINLLPDNTASQPRRQSCL